MTEEDDDPQQNLLSIPMRTWRSWIPLLPRRTRTPYHTQLGRGRVENRCGPTSGPPYHTQWGLGLVIDLRGRMPLHGRPHGPIFQKDYRVEVTISDNVGLSVKESTVLYTGSGPTLVNEGCLSQTFSDTAVTTSLSRLRASGNEPMRVEKFIPLDVQLGDKSVKVWFRVVNNLAVEVVLGTLFWTALSGRYFPPSSKSCLSAQSPFR